MKIQINGLKFKAEKAKVSHGQHGTTMLAHAETLGTWLYIQAPSGGFEIRDLLLEDSVALCGTEGRLYGVEWIFTEGNSTHFRGQNGAVLLEATPDGGRVEFSINWSDTESDQPNY